MKDGASNFPEGGSKAAERVALIPLLYLARGLRGFGDGFAIIVLPAYMTAAASKPSAVM